MTEDGKLNKRIQRLEESEKHYRQLLDESSDPTFSFYRDGTYRYVNKAFANGVGKPADQIIGKNLWDIFEKEEADKRYAIVVAVFTQAETKEIEVRVPLPTGDTYYLTTAKPIFSENGEVDAVICSSKNITKRKLAEIALQEEHQKLKEAMAEIEVLSGFLPICTSCKKVRDDKGYWNQIETYLQKKSEVEFTHSLCPGCFKSLYGNESWYDKVKSKLGHPD